MPFLPPVSGASAFSNYSNTTGYSAPLVNKVNAVYAVPSFYLLFILESIPREECDGLLSSHVLSIVQEMNEFYLYETFVFKTLQCPWCFKGE